MGFLSGIGAKAGLMLGNWWVRVVLIALALAALGFAVHSVIKTVRDWQTEAYNNGFRTGSEVQEARWQRVSAENARKQTDQLLVDVKRGNDAVQTYLASKAAVEPEIIRVKEEVVRYAQSTSGRDVCLDDDGVRLELQGRAAAGLVGSPAAAPAAPGPVHGDLRGAAAEAGVQH